MEFLLILVVVAVALAVWAIKTYNKLQSAKQSIVEQASNINVSLQKRRDLASRVMEIAQGFGDHEKLTHMQVSANSSTENLSALSQSFPELKANETFLKLMNQLEQLEDNISDKRESYNKTVNVYNSYRSGFPTMLVANKLQFEVAPYYDADNEDSLNQLATFMRDDSAAVQDLINSSSAKLKSSASNITNSAKQHIGDVKNSDAVQSAFNQSEAAIKNTIIASKKKIEELSTKNEEIEIVLDETIRVNKENPTA